ncbi:MAG: hypothetical protein R2754_02535 [Microthrixaceae bacterium]
MALSLHDLHADVAWVVIVANAAVGLWALGAHWWAPLRVQAMWAAIVVAEVSIFVQVALGVANLAGNRAPGDDFHIFYGFVALITVGILYGYRTQLRAYAYLLYGWGSLFLMGLCIRAMLLA